MCVDYRRKLYALIENPLQPGEAEAICSKLVCFNNDFGSVKNWWNSPKSNYAAAIANTSDRVNLESNSTNNSEIEIRHPISGQSQTIAVGGDETREQGNFISLVPEEIRQCTDAKIVYHWFWRFFAELKAQQKQKLLLYPANEVLPDCPWHSYQTTVSALVGAIYPKSWQPGDEVQTDSDKRPYLFIFTFSPVQEFIKSSRKFLDFWAGSYLLHYLGAKVCWCIAERYGADAVITPSLWQQEIIDAFLAQEFDSEVGNVFTRFFDKQKSPSDRFTDGESTSLVTAGFPNVITALIPGKAEADKLGEELTRKLGEIWQEIALKVRKEVESKVREQIKNEDKLDELWKAIANEFNAEPYKTELENWRTDSRWTWRSLWEAQIDNTWESYWSAVPLGDPQRPLSTITDSSFENWQDSQNNLAKSRIQPSIATDAEIEMYTQFNVGTWWGSFQARLGQLIQAVKNTRSWQIPTAPGERSSLSGQYSALHPQQLYHRFPDGGGLPTGSLRLFWRVMAEVFPGLFNGSEILNAIELTKRMAWGYGGVAESLGVDVERLVIQTTQIADSNSEEEQTRQIEQNRRIYYENLIRFPNLSSIAAARFATDYQGRIRQYWGQLSNAIGQNLSTQERDKFAARTRGRPFHIHNVDRAINPGNDRGQNFNGVMFSSKWLADDMGLEPDRANSLRVLVEQAHRETGFKNGSPADWWVIVLGDGDGMGKYVSGAKLHNYEKYIVDARVADNIRTEAYGELCANTKKRMGPATHVALNRALLDFSNRLVPYITEHRFCGKVVYSGGDDVMAVLPLADLPQYLLSIRAAWSGTEDPEGEFNNSQTGNDPEKKSGYWHPKGELKGIPQRPLFTMGEGATMSLGIVIAYKSIPLPTVLETLWEAEKERAKKMPGAGMQDDANSIPVKDGLCFRVIYGSGNVLEALMKGHLLETWQNFVDLARQETNALGDLSPLLYRLAEELPKHTDVTKDDRLIAKAAAVIINKRDRLVSPELQTKLVDWLNLWEEWAFRARESESKKPENQRNLLATGIQDLSKILRFTAFWLDKMAHFDSWITGGDES